MLNTIIGSQIIQEEVRRKSFCKEIGSGDCDRRALCKMYDKERGPHLVSIVPCDSFYRVLILYPIRSLHRSVPTEEKRRDHHFLQAIKIVVKC
ncbi:MAG: hypothetical protein Q4A75_05180 [Peptostreptococcaceae bacterium]|nr:hypothetical protein [Peptostreptococcaceae bacterium]